MAKQFDKKRLKKEGRRNSDPILFGEWKEFTSRMTSDMGVILDAQRNSS